MPGTFPTLRTGAIAQYPLARELRQAAETVTFLDGSAQAYRLQAAPLHRWTLKLDLLDDRELSTLRAFFEQQKARWGTFSFTDPWTNVTYPQCSFERDTFPQQQRAENRNSVVLTIREHV